VFLILIANTRTGQRNGSECYVPTSLGLRDRAIGHVNGLTNLWTRPTGQRPGSNAISEQIVMLIIEATV
jgi:hypothetical protein